MKATTAEIEQARKPIRSSISYHFAVSEKTGCAATATYCQPSADSLHCGVIKRFCHKGLETLFLTGSAKGIDPALAPKLRRMLSHLNDGPLPKAMMPPGYRLHQLKGDRKGSWAAWVTGNYRLVFEIDGEDADNVDLVDHH